MNTYLRIFFSGLLIVATYLQAQTTTLTDLQQISRQVQKLVPYLKARTVAVKIKVGPRTGYGTGAVISSDGLILTCAHVAEVSDELTIITSAGKELAVQRLGMNKINDYALLRVPAKNMPYFTLGESKDLQLLQWAIALGHPGGPYPDHQPAVAIGRIRGLHKKLPIQLGVKFYDDAVQTDIPIFAGNSGGPLLDLKGRLIGINGAIMLVNDLAFAVPIDEIKKDLEILRRGENVLGRSPGGFLDILKILNELQEDVPPEDMFKMFRNTPLGKLLQRMVGKLKAPTKSPARLGVDFAKNYRGIVVYRVHPNSLAEIAGLKAGDKVVTMDGKRVRRISHLHRIIKGKGSDGLLKMQIRRRDKVIKLKVILSKKAYSRSRCFQRAFVYRGLELSDVTVRVKTADRDLGYGVIISPEGLVLTNYQILGDRREVMVQMQNRAADVYPAKVLASHGIYDVALLQFSPPHPMRAVKIGDDHNLKIGQWVLSGGSRQGIIQGGMVSALGREVPPKRKIPTMGLFGMLGRPNKSKVRAYEQVIQHDSAIEKDQFGTPLVDENGALVGINVGHYYRGTTFATPISLILKVLPEMKAGKSTATPKKYRPYQPQIDPISRLFRYFVEEEKSENLGEILHDLMQRKSSKRSFLGVRVAQHTRGIEIVSVITGYGAERAGLKKGDIIIKINKQKSGSIVELLERLKHFPPGSEIFVTVLRKENSTYREKKFKVTLSGRPY